MEGQGRSGARSEGSDVAEYSVWVGSDPGLEPGDAKGLGILEAKDDRGGEGKR